MIPMGWMMPMCIAKGVEEGAKLILDGRNIQVEEYEDGFYTEYSPLLCLNNFR